MAMSHEQEKKAREQFEKDIKDVNNDDVEYASKKGQSKVNKFGDNPPGPLQSLWRDIKLMIGLVTDYAKGNYRDVPWNVLAAVTGAVIYFVSPVDVIPDVIPVVGYLDDALVVKLALEIARPDLEAYANWKNA
ncbi:YkvA family protein [Salinivibrio costicola]|uniref:YkvA family protein n=1 Tax=Salinivibrio costicola TaxID=51367 RepID=UPI003F70F545